MWVGETRLFLFGRDGVQGWFGDACGGITLDGVPRFDSKFVCASGGSLCGTNTGKCLCVPVTNDPVVVIRDYGDFIVPVFGIRRVRVVYVSGSQPDQVPTFLA